MGEPISTGDGISRMAFWSGDEWRWRLQSHGPYTITVIDAAEQKPEPENAHRVPFGFSRVLHPAPTEPEPQTWEGED